VEKNNEEPGSAAERAVHELNLPLTVTNTGPGAPAETEITDESGRSKRKRIPREMNLNGCLCGSTVNPSTAVVPVIKCKRKGCETQWVSDTTVSVPIVLIN
jgi:hypothetical protein